MKKRMVFAAALALVIARGVFAEECTVYFSGYKQGVVTVTKDAGGKITVRCPSLKDKDGNVNKNKFGSSIIVRVFSSECPLLPAGKNIVISGGDVRVIDGNTETWTMSNGYWTKTVVDGNTKTWTDSKGFKRVTQINGTAQKGYSVFIEVTGDGDYEPGWI